jgi:hypothetical protein
MAWHHATAALPMTLPACQQERCSTLLRQLLALAVPQVCYAINVVEVASHSSDSTDIKSLLHAQHCLLINLCWKNGAQV